MQRSVDCDKSGVIITTGLHSHDTSSITVSFSRGFGGAVDAQAAESYELSATGAARLYSPAREPSYQRLNRSGGTVTLFTTFEKLLLSKSELERIHRTAATIKQRLPAAPGIESSGPFDIELGFKEDTLFLFQARPFVENKKAQGSEYLRSLDIIQSAGAPLPLHTPLVIPAGAQP